jgi:uncharacterized protein (DUF58 family)
VIKITKAGWIYVLLTIVVGFAAVNTANNLIYILASALLSYMLISGVFGRKNIHALTVQVLYPEELYAGTPTPVTVRLINPRTILPALLIRVLVEDGEVFFPYVAAAGSSDAMLQFSFPCRGPYRIDKIILASTFPFNFFTRFRTIRHAFETMVFPKPKPCVEAIVERETRYRRGDQPSDRLGDTTDILAIRDYIPGDPLKRIHWKSTAKTDRLKTREFSAADEPDVIIDFEQLPIRDLEERISCVTFWLLQLARSNRCFGLKIAGAFHPARRSTAHKRALLRVLALYGQS